MANPRQGPAAPLRYKVDQLEAELASGGFPIRVMVLGDKASLLQDDGTSSPIPAGAQSILDAHVPQWPVPPPVPDFGTDDQPPAQIANAVSALRQYLGVASPTTAQSTQALKLLIRVVLFLLRQVVLS